MMNATTITAADPGQLHRSTLVRLRAGAWRWACNRAGWTGNHLADLAGLASGIECAAARRASRLCPPVLEPAELARRETRRAEETARDAAFREISLTHDCPALNRQRIFKTGCRVTPPAPGNGAPDTAWIAWNQAPRQYTALMTCAGCGQQWEFDETPH